MFQVNCRMGQESNGYECTLEVLRMLFLLVGLLAGFASAAAATTSSIKRRPLAVASQVRAISSLAMTSIRILLNSLPKVHL